MNVLAGRRVTVTDAYLPLGATPANLTIRPDAHVDRPVCATGRAVGVRLADGTVVEAGHVVLCAGVYGSPAILLRSGIGPSGETVDLPGVGANLADHPSLWVDFGHRGGGRDVPYLHTIVTFHSSGRPSSETPDLADTDFGADVVLNLDSLIRSESALHSAHGRDLRDGRGRRRVGQCSGMTPEFRPRPAAGRMPIMQSR